MSPPFPCKSLHIQVRKYILRPKLSPPLNHIRFKLVTLLYVPSTFIELRLPTTTRAQRRAINVCYAEEEITTSAAFAEVVPARWASFHGCASGFWGGRMQRRLLVSICT